MKNILITGCAGFIGSALSTYLLKKKIHVTGIDNLSDYYDVEIKKQRLSNLKSFSNFTYINEDISKINQIKTSQKISVVINLAAQAGVRVKEKDISKYFHSNVLGFIEILTYCKNRKIPLIYASSSSVYGDNEGVNKESAELNPKSIYASTKVFNENIAKNFTQNFSIQAIGLRFFTVFGRDGRPDMAYYKFTKKILNEEEITLYDNGDHFRDMTHISKITSMIYSILNGIETLPNHDVFNLGNGSPIKTSEMLKEIEKCLNKKAKIIHKKSVAEVGSTYACMDKFYSKFGTKKPYNTMFYIKDFVKWYEKKHR